MKKIIVLTSLGLMLMGITAWAQFDLQVHSFTNVHQHIGSIVRSTNWVADSTNVDVKIDDVYMDQTHLTGFVAMIEANGASAHVAGTTNTYSVNATNLVLLKLTAYHGTINGTNPSVPMFRVQWAVSSNSVTP